MLNRATGSFKLVDRADVRVGRQAIDRWFGCRVTDLLATGQSPAPAQLCPLSVTDPADRLRRRLNDRLHVCACWQLNPHKGRADRPTTNRRKCLAIDADRVVSSDLLRMAARVCNEAGHGISLARRI